MGAEEVKIKESIGCKIFKLIDLIILSLIDLKMLAAYGFMRKQAEHRKK